MAIQFIAAGTAGTGGSGNVTPATPAGIYSNDVLILIVHSRDNVAHSVNSGYAEIVQGNGNTTNRLSVWWKRTTGIEGTNTVTHTSGDSISSRIYAYRGCYPWGNPWHVAGSVQSNAGDPISTSAITTLINNCMILHVFGSQDNNTWGTFTGCATTNRGGATDSAGTDDSVNLCEGVQGLAGSTGVAGASQATLGPDAGVSVLIALQPLVQPSFPNYQFVRVGNGASTGERI